MKKTILFFVLISFTFLAAQPYSVTYNVNVPVDCEGTSQVLVATGSAMEGSEFTFPKITLPAPFDYYQSFAAVFSEAVIGLPEGSLNENVTFNVNLEPFFCGTESETLLNVLNLTVEVVGDNSGAHPPFSYYDFNEGKRAYLKLKAENLFNYLESYGTTLEEMLGWFYKEGFTPDFTGIEFKYTNGDEYVVFNFAHFSKIAIGKLLSPTDVKNNGAIPTEYKLNQNYPNPFNPSTKISYSLPNSGYTTLTIYNSIGVEVETLVSEEKSAGNYEIVFDASKLSSGIYFYNLTSGNFQSTRKMILIK